MNEWDGYEELLNFGLATRLMIDPKHHPVLIAEPTFNPSSLRQKITEIMFEKFDVPAFFLSKNAVLTAFASGRSSGLILDSGGGYTSTVAVSDGYALIKSINLFLILFLFNE